MWHEPSSLEQAHSQLRQAAQHQDAAAMEEIARQCPQVVQPMPGWSQSPLQEIASRMFGWDCRPEQLECMAVLIRHGASPMQAHAYSPAPFDTLLERGVVKAFEKMHAMGELGRSLQTRSTDVLSKLFTSTTWRNYSGDYPIEALTRLMLDAGANTRLADGRPALHHLLWTAVPQYGTRIPNGMEAACALMLEADPSAEIGPTQMIQAWRANFQAVAPTLMQRYAQQGGTLDALQLAGDAAVAKPAQMADLQAWWLQHASPDTRVAPAAERRIRF